MNADQFAVLIQMLEAIRLQLGAAGATSGPQRADYRQRAEIQAEQAIKDAQYLASLPQVGPA